MSVGRGGGVVVVSNFLFHIQCLFRILSITSIQHLNLYVAFDYLLNDGVCFGLVLIECRCNNHGLSCKYNDTLGLGICTSCQHNTVGQHCEKCRAMFYRDSSVSLDHPNTCIGEQQGSKKVPSSVLGQVDFLAG